MKIKKIIALLVLLVASSTATFADGVQGDPEILYKYQFGAELQYKIMKGLKVDISPEFRFNDGYDKFLLSGGVSYKTFGCIYWGATYRIIVDRYESGTTTSMFGGTSTNYESETFHRYAFDVTYKDKFGRFTPSFRLRYNNFTDEGVDDKEFMRYRAKVDYDIRKCKITPFVSVEAYHGLEENLLYKTRYSAGFDLKTGKDSALSFDYKLDFFALEYKNANIFSLGYKFKF
ncbi:MAG: DUF2490 domain-containing protein [Rikenellaceae bacterium]